MTKDKDYCSNHECLVNEINHLKDDHKELREEYKELSNKIEMVREDIQKLSSHEKIYIAIIGFIGIVVSTGGSAVGVLITKVLFISN